MSRELPNARSPIGHLADGTKDVTDEQSVGIIFSFSELTMDICRIRAWRRGRSLHLGPTEYRLLRYFLEHPNQTISREQLLNAVWVRDTRVKLRTVDVHIGRLRKTMNFESLPDLIRTVRSTGYRLEARSTTLPANTNGPSDNDQDVACIG